MHLHWCLLCRVDMLIYFQLASSPRIIFHLCNRQMDRCTINKSLVFVVGVVVCMQPCTNHCPDSGLSYTFVNCLDTLQYILVLSLVLHPSCCTVVVCPFIHWLGGHYAQAKARGTYFFDAFLQWYMLYASGFYYSCFTSKLKCTCSSAEWSVVLVISPLVSLMIG